MLHTVNLADLMPGRPAPAPFYEVTPRLPGWHLRCVDIHGVEVKSVPFLDQLDAVEEGELFLTQSLPWPSYTAHVFIGDKSFTIACRDEAEFLDIVDSLDACTVEMYSCGSMVLHELGPLPDVAPGVYPLALAA